MTDRAECRRCRKQIAQRERGGARAHNCPHGFVCVGPGRDKPRTRESKRFFAAAGCTRCFLARQLELFAPEILRG